MCPECKAGLYPWSHMPGCSYANHIPKCTCPRAYRLTHNTWEHKARCPGRSTEAYCAHPARRGKHEAYAKGHKRHANHLAWVCRACGYDSESGMPRSSSVSTPASRANRGVGRSPTKDQPKLRAALREAKKALRGEPKGEDAQGIGVFLEVNALRALVEACERGMRK